MLGLNLFGSYNIFYIKAKSIGGVIGLEFYLTFTFTFIYEHRERAVYLPFPKWKTLKIAKSSYTAAQKKRRFFF